MVNLQVIFFTELNDIQNIELYVLVHMHSYRLHDVFPFTPLKVLYQKTVFFLVKKPQNKDV
jgi:hypothetical protein